MKTWGIYIRNCAGTTIYHIGRYSTKEKAFKEAKRGYKWFKINPDINSIVEV